MITDINLRNLISFSFERLRRLFFNFHRFLFSQPCSDLASFGPNKQLISQFGGKNKKGEFNENNHEPFVAGDTRVGEFPGKFSTLTII